MLVHEEGQQAPELLSVLAVAMTRVPCLVIFVGDANQSPGGIKDSKLAQYLGRDLMRLPIGLRAGQKSRTPANLSVALTRATAFWQGLDVADALSHTGAVSTGSDWQCVCSMVKALFLSPRRDHWVRAAPLARQTHWETLILLHEPFGQHRNVAS